MSTSRASDGANEEREKCLQNNRDRALGRKPLPLSGKPGHRRVTYPDTGCIQKFRVNYVEAISVKNETPSRANAGNWLDFWRGTAARHGYVGMVLCESERYHTGAVNRQLFSMRPIDGVDTCEGRAPGRAVEKLTLNREQREPRNHRTWGTV